MVLFTNMLHLFEYGIDKLYSLVIDTLRIGPVELLLCDRDIDDLIVTVI